MLTRHITGKHDARHATALWRSSATAGRLLGVLLGNLAILIVTLGFGLPIVLHRWMRFAADMLQVSGYPDPQTPGQNDQAPLLTGVGMHNVLGHGSAF